MRIFIGILLLLWSLLRSLVGYDLDRTIQYSDFSQQKIYSHEVAVMVKEMQEEECVVITKTDGSVPDFSELKEQPLQIVKGPQNRFTFLFENRDAALQAIQILEETEGVLYAELDQDIISEETETSDDLPVPQKKFRSWGAEQMGFEIFRNYTETCGIGSCIVAVIDSGTFPHKDYVDRLISGGFDYVDADLDSTSDLFGHGTKVTGILSDCAENLPVYFLPIRVLNNLGKGKMSNLINAIYEAVDSGAEVLNLSLGSAVHSAALEDAIKYAVSCGANVVSAAGNSGTNADSLCPGHNDIPGLIIVGSAEKTKNGYERSYYSNYGNSVDLYAYGTNIECCSMNGEYEKGTGTSFATPHISAACAMLYLLEPTMNPKSNETLLKKLCPPEPYSIPNLSDYVPQWLGTSLEKLTLSKGEQIRFMKMAFPVSCEKKIEWTSTESEIAVVENGNLLKCLSLGMTVIHGKATDFCEVEFLLEVTESDTLLDISAPITEIQEESFADLENVVEIHLSEGIKMIGDRAFAGNRELKTIWLPESTQIIGNDFINMENITIICEVDSYSLQYARDNKYPYLVIEEEISADTK